MYLFARRWLLTTLLVLIASGVMVRLGFWQLDRLHQKRTLIAQTLKVIQADPWHLTGEEMDLDARAWQHRRAIATGSYDFDHQVVLKNQLYQEQPGYHLLTPFRLAGSDRAVLVDRGWIPASTDLQDLSPFDESDVHQVEGRIEPSATRPPAATLPATPQQTWYRVDIEGIQKQIPYPLLPFYLALTPGPGDPELPWRDPPEIVLDQGPHLGYAIQWFLFAILVPIIYGVQVRRMERARESSKD